MSTVKSPPRALRNWPSDQKVYIRRTRPYPSDHKANRRSNAKGTKPTVAEMRALTAVAIAGQPTAAAELLATTVSVLNDRLQRLKWRADTRSWRPLIWTLLVLPLRRKIDRLERELTEARATIDLLAEAESEAEAA